MRQVMFLQYTQGNKMYLLSGIFSCTSVEFSRSFMLSSHLWLQLPVTSSCNLEFREWRNTHEKSNFFFILPKHPFGWANLIKLKQSKVPTSLKQLWEMCFPSYCCFFGWQTRRHNTSHYSVFDVLSSVEWVDSYLQRYPTTEEHYSKILKRSLSLS